jgi:hypothetical protein
MDVWGIIVFIGFAFAFWLTKNRQSNLARFYLFGAGIGTGMLIASAWLAINLYQVGLIK